jgi:hypothetical protein
VALLRDWSPNKTDRMNEAYSFLHDALYAKCEKVVDGLGDDTRSDTKGPEPEHIEFGMIGDDLFAFVGLERANGIMLFELDDSGPTPDFEYQGVFHTQGDVGPEVFTVRTGATGKTELLVANEVSGTATLYEIEAVPEPFTLQILHASDLEAGLLATSRMGNFAAIVDRLEDEYLNTLTLFSGDNWIPGPFYAAEADPSLEAALEAFYGVNLPAGPQVSGRVSLAFMNAVGTDAAVVPDGCTNWPGVTSAGARGLPITSCQVQSAAPIAPPASPAAG